MKLLVYYTLEGNCEWLAQQIKKATDCDLLLLKPCKAYPTGKVSKYIWGGKSVLFNNTPKLLNRFIDLTNYDKIIFGTPIWAGKFTPPILTFIKENKIVNKDIYCFASHGGGGAEQCFKAFERLLNGNKIISKVDFIEPLKNPSSELDEKIRLFCQTINHS